MGNKEKEQMLKACNDRNKHIVQLQAEAMYFVNERLQNGYPKQDLILLTELMIDTIKRFD